MYGSRGAMLGSGGVSDGYEIGSKRPRMMESNPYFAVSSGSTGFQPYGSSPSGFQSYSSGSSGLPPYNYGNGGSSGLPPYGFGSGPSGLPPYGYGSGFQSMMFPVVRLRGLPFNCTDIDIFKFFGGLDIVDVLLVNRKGRFSGEAFVVFSANSQADLALQKDRQDMGRRYVEVFRCKKQEYYLAVADEVNYEGIYDNDFHGSSPPARSKRFSEKDKLEYTEILKLRGLPYTATVSSIMEFFGDFDLTKEKIHIACRPDGKATGEAYVEFSSAEEAKKAMSKDKMTIGSRYVELFPSTPDEARRAKSRSRQ